MTGYTFFYRGKDVFVITSQKCRTKPLAAEILRKMGLNYDDPRKVAELFSALRKAECEYKMLNNGKQMYRIYGDKFAICGFVEDDDLVVIDLTKRR